MSISGDLVRCGIDAIPREHCEHRSLIIQSGLVDRLSRMERTMAIATAKIERGPQE
jgi:hypothetical protein